MACLLFLYLGSVGVLRWWGVAICLAVWTPLFMLSCRWFTRRPRRAVLLPVLGVVPWLALVALAVLTG